MNGAEQGRGATTLRGCTHSGKIDNRGYAGGRLVTLLPVGAMYLSGVRNKGRSKSWRPANAEEAQAAGGKERTDATEKSGGQEPKETWDKPQSVVCQGRGSMLAWGMGMLWHPCVQWAMP